MGFIIINRSLRMCVNSKLLRNFSSKSPLQTEVVVCGQTFKPDEYTNISPKIISLIGRNLYQLQCHPLYHVQKQIVNYFYNSYKNARGNPIFSIHENLSPIVTVSQNFDSLLVPIDHVSRKKSDNYYINKDLLMRAHMTAYQVDLMKMGLDNFLYVGDVYRRDEIDSSHYPVFHQLDGVRLFSAKDIFKDSRNLFQHRDETPEHQGTHTDEVVHFVSQDLRQCLSGLANSIFGKDVELRWVDAYFPFTHPSWELEVKINDKWVEMLGCGIMRQEILCNAGIKDKVGWAFGIGLERWAMKLYEIPDIRIFWSQDERFYTQFRYEDCSKRVQYKPYSLQPPCINDISFWLPEDDHFDSSDLFDLVRTVGGDIIEQVLLVDEFTHPKTKRSSKCFRIYYRSWDRVLNQKEVNAVHKKIEDIIVKNLFVVIR